MICRLVFNLTCKHFQSKLLVFTTADVDLEGRVRTVFKVLIRHFLCSWQSAKTPGGGSFGNPRQEECLCLTIHIATALHLFSACTLDVTSTVMTRMHVRSSVCAHSPSSGSSVNESCAQDTEQKHGKQTLLLCFCFAAAFCFDAAVATLLLLCCFLCCFDVAVATAFATASAAASAA